MLAATGADSSAALDWFKAAVPLGVAGIAAWAGYRYGLQRTRDERRFDKRLAWYEAALAATGALRESIIRAAIAERQRADLRDDDGSWEAQGAEVGRLTAACWREVQDHIAELLRVLQRAVLNADVESEAAAAKAVVVLNSCSRWFTDLANYYSFGHPTDEHEIHVTRQGEHSPLLGGVLAELRAVDAAVIAGARAALGYPPRLPELVPNAEGVIVIPSRDTDRTPVPRKIMRRLWLAVGHTFKFNV